MKIVILDDVQNAIRGLDAFAQLAAHDVTVYTDSTTDTDVLASRLADADALVLIRERTKISAALLERLPRLKLISQTGRGYPHIDIEACNRLGIKVAVGGGGSESTAELTWALIMASMRHLPQEIAGMKAGKWQSTPQLGRALNKKVLGIYGYGRIGQLVARYGQAFGMRVLIWGREASIAYAEADGYQTVDSKATLFKISDVLSLHIKLNAETRGIITRQDLALMKPDALIVNTSRAELIADGALVDALKAGAPGFAAVDVYEDEPVKDHPLLALDNVICTPHLGYVERDNYESFFSAAFENVNNFFAGEATNIANP